MGIRTKNLLLLPVACAAMAATSLSAHAGAAGLRVAVDPQTGKLRAPTAEESQALDAASAQPALVAPRVGMLTGRIDPQPFTHPDGTVQLELDSSTMSYSVARIGAGGKVEMQCVTGAQAAERFVKSSKPVAKVSQAAKEKLDVK